MRVLIGIAAVGLLVWSVSLLLGSRKQRALGRASANFETADFEMISKADFRKAGPVWCGGDGRTKHPVSAGQAAAGFEAGRSAGSQPVAEPTSSARGTGCAVKTGFGKTTLS